MENLETLVQKKLEQRFQNAMKDYNNGTLTREVQKELRQQQKREQFKKNITSLTTYKTFWYRFSGNPFYYESIPFGPRRNLWWNNFHWRIFAMAVVILLVSTVFFAFQADKNNLSFIVANNIFCLGFFLLVYNTFLEDIKLTRTVISIVFLLCFFGVYLKIFPECNLLLHVMTGVLGGWLYFILRGSSYKSLKEIDKKSGFVF